MKLYHGSNVEVINPEIVNAKGSLDFGAAFYTTSDYEQAKKWAKLKKERTMKGAAIVSEFDFDESRMKDLEIRTFTSADKEWLKYISSCRKLKDTDRTSDIIIGPVANDNTINVINFYLTGVYDEDEAIKRLLAFKLKDQYAFKTVRSLELLTFSKKVFV